MTNKAFLESTAPLVSFGKTVPTDIREWERAFFYLNLWMRTNSNVADASGMTGKTKAIVDNTATLDTRTTTDFGTVLTYIGDTGQAASQRLLNQVSSGSKSSTQSVSPMSSTDSGGGLAQIAVASHSVQYGFGTVAYNSGTITGLLNSTLYYVYANDPTYVGGAVTYLSTTNANIPTSANGYYYVGKVTTAAGGGGGTSGSYGGGGGRDGSPL